MSAGPTPREFSPPMLASMPGTRSPYAPNDDELTEKRIPVSPIDDDNQQQSPRRVVSPLSPVRDFIARRATRKQVPRPIEVTRSRGLKRDMLSPAMHEVDLRSPQAESPAAREQAKSKTQRRTVWGMIDGWWDLGLLERMNTIKRKKPNKQTRGGMV
ncbi:hypothetical protein V8F06_002748 [Rhypophila decipiens]